MKLKLQYFGHHMKRVDSLEKTLMLGGSGSRRRRGQQRMRWLDDITLMTESKEELKSLLEVKMESENVDLKLNVQKTKIMASGSITSWEIAGQTVNSARLYFLGLQNHCRW